jgi:hypothetical protein
VRVIVMPIALAQLDSLAWPLAVGALVLGAVVLAYFALRPHPPLAAAADEAPPAEDDLLDDTFSQHRAWVHDAGLAGRELFLAIAESSRLRLNLDRLGEALHGLRPSVSPTHAAAIVGRALKAADLSDAPAQLERTCDELRSRLRDALERRRSLADGLLPAGAAPPEPDSPWETELDAFLGQARPQAEALGRRHHRLCELLPAYASLLEAAGRNGRGRAYVAAFFDPATHSARGIPLEERIEMKESEFAVTFAHAFRHFEGQALALSRSLRAAARSVIEQAIASDEEYQSRLLDELRRQAGEGERLEELLPALRRPWRLTDDGPRPG